VSVFSSKVVTILKIAKTILFPFPEKKLGGISKKLSLLYPITGFPFSRGFKKVNAQGFGCCFYNGFL